MDSSPQISVIIPTYKRSAYLREAIASVLAQTFTDFELLVVDDGSSDDTAEVVAAFGDKRIHYIFQENAGRSAARNRGMAESHGEFIAFLDDDDLYLPHKLAVEVAFLERHPEVGLVASGARIIAADGSFIRDWKTWEGQPRPTLDTCIYACALLTCAILFRRCWLDTVDQWFDREMEAAEDTDFWLRLLLAGCRMEWLPEIVAANRVHRANSQQNVAGYRSGNQRILDKLFSQPDRLPEEILHRKAEIYAHHHLISALRAYSLGQWADAQTDLRAAANQWAPLDGGSTQHFADQVAGFAARFDAPRDADFVHAVFAHLPPELTCLAKQRARALSQLYMGRVFRAVGAGERFSCGDWLRGTAYDPGWLRNRGVWSVLLKRVLPWAVPEKDREIRRVRIK